ncbi:FAD/NAD(P)-binding protein [Legionella oakridgensis]|uniref:FAD-dependent urate hydroxylase HpyO/Asp monooxygenase CreE-like FAD/NAD(P)-binding domain-containing protein n=2 Tax=Legionella oakridgensis TaxID=29423 RepID=W0BAK0_9GAMM|nr:FAD/NAD(P)-binding protein [Legionella oakridgensis]AHE67568.1 hypothetical protein Loa_02024 [Legionella oakridgensis ATCC 33761 = DSM 21215]ETO92813.1 hypothetical protein LOR_61c14670 [Legionella oakridgensis RV-2-2007]KTD37081.1 hypothetical protein Loak_2217 [Legionella oakridgensis]STY20610.1 Uncharacterized protein conserved in bacteria [Legionella longbeachae]
MSKHLIKIAIIGGGPAGVSLCLQLAKSLKNLTLKSNVHLLLFEKSTAIGYGLPYSINENVFNINLPREYMTLIPGEHHHFSNWLHDLQKIPESTTFPSRYYFGQYAHNQLLNAKKNLKSPALKIMTLTEHDVFDILSEDDQNYQIHARHQHTCVLYTAQVVILATGHLPSTLFSHYHHLPNYQHNPWDMSAYRKFASHHHVVIIGTHLTAIDVALKLYSQKHQGHMTMVSRTGLLSAVRGRKLSHSMQYLTPSTIRYLLKTHDSTTLLSQLERLFEKEISLYFPHGLSLWDTINQIKKMPPLKRLKHEIKNAELNEANWQLVLSCFYQILFKIWPKLHPQEQLFFLEKHASLMFAFLCAFPLTNAYIIQSMMVSKQLSIQGGIIDIEYNEPHFFITLNNGTSLTADYLIRATGSGDDPKTVPLLAQMLTRKLIKKHPLGGIYIDTNTHHVLTDKQKNPPSIYALGDLVKGACFRMIEIGQVVEQARIISDHITQTLNLAG